MVKPLGDFVTGCAVYVILSIQRVGGWALYDVPGFKTPEQKAVWLGFWVGVSRNMMIYSVCEDSDHTGPDQFYQV